MFLRTQWSPLRRYDWLSDLTSAWGWGEWMTAAWVVVFCSVVLGGLVAWLWAIRPGHRPQAFTIDMTQLAGDLRRAVHAKDRPQA
jgi:hypothetical protein